jgi:hypothetical protein
MKIEIYSSSLKLVTMGINSSEPIHPEVDVPLHQECVDQYNMLKASIRTQLNKIEANIGAQPILKALQDTVDDHTILFLIGNDHSTPFGIITHKHVFRVKWNEKLYLCPMYTFHNPLDEHGIHTILQLYKDPVLAPHEPWRASIMQEMMSRNNDDPLYQLYRDPRFANASKSFEFLIRTIPGSYRNGDWRQLHGFFGMYYRLPHSDLSDCPPMAL